MSDKNINKKTNNNSVDKNLMVKSSIVWAVLMLAIAFLLSGKMEIESVNNTIFIFMIGAWYISHSFILKAQGKGLIPACERKFLKRLGLFKS